MVYQVSDICWFLTSWTNESISKPSWSLALSRRPHPQPDWSLLDRRATLLWRHRRKGAERCKHRFRPHACDHIIEVQNKLQSGVWAGTTKLGRQIETDGGNSPETLTNTIDFTRKEAGNKWWLVGRLPSID
jgi:hypothetical protein